MPWLALPFGDARKSSLVRKFKVQGIPMLIVIGPTGKTVTKEARCLVMAHGVDAYPFSEERLKEIEAQYEEMTKGWPKKLKHKLHEEHELELTRSDYYTSDGCNKRGEVWSFCCIECDFDLHPKCALEKNKETKGDTEEEGNTKEGWVCDGEVCTRA
ncbi:nucleoredoxin 1 [Hibiscus trionum]|uniref:protein-disulfide reductase n=1 Tax=Hibiscus trionum TaxID=183268 RepID=A0A9W7JGZ7_HIBTR|nr:nucleoredoxin 1 [Hibiscus trionum]